MNNGSAIPMAPTTSADPSEFGDYSEWAQQEMAKGFSSDQLKQTLAQNGVQLPSSQPAQSAPAAGQQPGQQQDSGSWWKSLIPAAGGVLGGILGGVADVGSLGILAPLINPITGAALGGAGGQMLENGLEGKQILQGNDVTSGIENGAGEALGLGLGKVVGALGEGVVNAGVKAGDKVAADAAGKLASKGAIDEAEATKLNYGGIGEKMANELELGKQQKFVKSMGFDATNPYDMEKVGSGVNELNNVYDRALSQSTPVDMKGVNNDIFKTLSKNGTTDLRTTPVGQALADFGKTSGVDISSGLPEQMNATDVRKLQQAVGRQIGNTQTIINNAELNGTYNADAEANLRTLQDMYQQLGDKIKTPEVNNAIQNFKVTDADRAGLVAKYGDKLGNHIADTITNAKSADDLLGPMQQLTKASHASRMAINDIENVTNSPRAVARAKFKANGGTVPSAASKGQNTALDTAEAAAHALHKPSGMVISAARRLHEAGVTPTIAKGLGNIIKRTAPLVAPATVVGSNIPGMEASVESNASAVPSNQGQGTAMQPAAATGAPVNPVNSVIDNILASMNRPGATLTPGYGTMMAGAGTFAPAAQSNELAANTLEALNPTFKNAGGPQGFGGILDNLLLSRVPGTAANTYQNQQLAAATQLAKILGTTPQAVLAMFPQLMQTPGVAAPQQQATTGLVGTLTAGLPAQ